MNKQETIEYLTDQIMTEDGFSVDGLTFNLVEDVMADLASASAYQERFNSIMAQVALGNTPEFTNLTHQLYDLMKESATGFAEMYVDDWIVEQEEMAQEHRLGI